MIRKTIGDVSFQLNEDFDFSFVWEYGEPFAVFDQQDSGNLCFGVRNKDRKLFLKIAGAATVWSCISTDVAIERLKSTVSVYEDLRHPYLTELLEHREIKGGYLLVFEWFEGVCMGKQYGSFDRFLGLPLNEKLGIYDAILDFHQHVNDCGYIAVDFYDGSILYHFDSHQTMLCDIEFYRRKPVINDMGRMWGSHRFMSPEEFQLGSEIDERSNVFCMGATAFELMGGGMDRSPLKWSASESLYQVALKAVSPEKIDRFPSIGEYREAWNNALLHSGS